MASKEEVYTSVVTYPMFSYNFPFFSLARDYMRLASHCTCGKTKSDHAFTRLYDIFSRLHDIWLKSKVAKPFARCQSSKDKLMKCNGSCFGIAL